MEDFENSFDLLVLDTKIIPPEAVHTLCHAHKVDQLQFDNFVKEDLLEKMKSIDVLHRIKLKTLSQK